MTLISIEYLKNLFYWFLEKTIPGTEYIVVRAIRVLILLLYTPPMDQLFNLEFQFKSIFNFGFQPKFGTQLGILISMGKNLGECTGIFELTAPQSCRKRTVMERLVALFL